MRNGAAPLRKASLVEGLETIPWLTACTLRRGSLTAAGAEPALALKWKLLMAHGFWFKPNANNFPAWHPSTPIHLESSAIDPSSGGSYSEIVTLVGERETAFVAIEIVRASKQRPVFIKAVIVPCRFCLRMADETGAKMTDWLARFVPPSSADDFTKSRR